jgi:hypothetical protein
MAKLVLVDEEGSEHNLVQGQETECEMALLNQIRKGNGRFRLYRDINNGQFSEISC